MELKWEEKEMKVEWEAEWIEEGKEDDETAKENKCRVWEGEGEEKEVKVKVNGKTKWEVENRVETYWSNPIHSLTGLKNFKNKYKINNYKKNHLVKMYSEDTIR